MPEHSDILQIRKYLNGELDAHAMHELEKRALDDPFLMEALEGYEQAGSDQQDNLADITDRLQQRTADKKVVRMVPWIPLSIAASVLIVIGAGVFFLAGNKTQKQPEIAQVTVPQEKKLKDITPATVDTNRPNAFAENTLEKKKATVAPNTIARASLPPTAKGENPNANEYTSAAPVASPSAPSLADADVKPVFKPHKDSVSLKEIVVSSKSVKKDTTANPHKHVAPVLQNQLLASKADGVTVTPDEPVTGHATHMKTLNGVVIGQDDGQPLTGATVKIVGSKFGAVTDANGRFALPNVGDDQTLSVGYLGYAAKKVKVSDKDSMSISLKPNTSSLSEVVVVTPTAQKATDKEAHPRDGWKALEAYFEKNAVSTDGQTGKVKVSFTVAGDGSLSNFKVIKSLSTIADQKAIDLIQQGTAWIGGADGNPKAVTVTVKFH